MNIGVHHGFYVNLRYTKQNFNFLFDILIFLKILEEHIKDHMTDQNSALRKHHLDTQHPLPEPTDKDIKILGT